MGPLREMWVRVRCVQARRIACGECGGRYTILADGRERASVLGVALVSSDEKLRKALWGRVRARLRKRDRDAGWGTGPCPHCGRYQRWMVRRSFARPAIPWGCGGVLVAWFAYLVATLPESGSFAMSLVWAALGGAAGVWVARLRALPSGAQRGRKDPRAIPDEDARGLLDHCRAVDGSPPVEWYLHLHERAPGKEVLVSMGCRDLTGEGFFPAPWTADAVLGRE